MSGNIVWPTLSFTIKIVSTNVNGRISNTIPNNHKTIQSMKVTTNVQPLTLDFANEMYTRIDENPKCLQNVLFSDGVDRKQTLLSYLRIQEIRIIQ